jgi:aspartate aminotransferase-like enzyme
MVASERLATVPWPAAFLVFGQGQFKGKIFRLSLMGYSDI